jgi:hypothetical protein
MTDDFEELSRLFDSARSTGSIEFIYAMTRVEGMSFDRPDPLAAPRANNESLTPEARNELLKLLENVIRCVQGLRYRGHIDAGTPEQLEELATASRDHGYAAIAGTLEAGGSQLDRLLVELLRTYQDQRRAALSARRVYKLGGFDVLELRFELFSGLPPPRSGTPA